MKLSIIALLVIWGCAGVKVTIKTEVGFEPVIKTDTLSTVRPIQPRNIDNNGEGD